MRKTITVLEFAISGALAIAVVAYVAHGALLMTQMAL
jgi:hypothetical protein